MPSLNISKNLGAISASLYVSFQVISNVLSTKIALVPLTSWSTDGGTILYPLTFTLRDFVHKTLGKKASRQIVLLAGLVNIFAAGLFWLVSKLNPDPAWGFQLAYEQILLPVWRITIASITAQIVSELVDTEVFSAVYAKFGDISGVLFSNALALLVDSLLFSFIAFYGNLPIGVVWQIVGTNIVIKLIVSLIFSPSIKLIPRQVGFEEI